MTQRPDDAAASPHAPPEIRPISEREFTLLQAFIQRESGIYLGSAKKSLLVGRLSRRLRELSLDSFGKYYRFLLEEDDGSERVRMVERICTHETAFFRESRQFEWLEQRVLPDWKREADCGHRARRIRAWSAGCSTGEEPYSLAMLLLEQFPAGSGWEIEIWATDLSTSALRKAQRAIWPLAQECEVPPRCVKQFMLRGTGGQAGKMKAGPEIRSLVRFQRLNLNDEAYGIRGPFDLILCRNVLIYFEQESRLRAIHRLLDHMAPHGLLFLGHSESLFGRTERVRVAIPTVYAFAHPVSSPAGPGASKAPVLASGPGRRRGGEG